MFEPHYRHQNKKKEKQRCDQDAGLVGVSKCKQTECLAAVDSGFGCALVAFGFKIVVEPQITCKKNLRCYFKAFIFQM